MCCTSSRCRRCSSRSTTSRPRSWPFTESSSRNSSAAAVSPSTTRSQIWKRTSSSTAPRSCRTSCTRDRAAGGRRELVEGRLGVAVGAAAAAGDQREGGIGDVDLLGVGDQAQLPDDVGEPRPLEDERLAARADGRQHLLQLGRAEHEDEVRRRLLDQLQQGVPRRVGELMRLVEDVDLRAALDRLQHDAVADVADVVDAALRGGVHLDHVERGAVRDRHAGVAGVVGLRGGAVRAVDSLGEDAGQRGLAGAARAGEQIGLAHLVLLDRVGEGAHDRLLPDDFSERLWAVLPVERGHGFDSRRSGREASRGSSGGECVYLAGVHGSPGHHDPPAPWSDDPAALAGRQCGCRCRRDCRPRSRGSERRAGLAAVGHQRRQAVRRRPDAVRHAQPRRCAGPEARHRSLHALPARARRVAGANRNPPRSKAAATEGSSASTTTDMVSAESKLLPAGQHQLTWQPPISLPTGTYTLQLVDHRADREADGVRHGDAGAPPSAAGADRADPRARRGVPAVELPAR